MVNQRWPFGTVAGHRVVRPPGSALVLGGADGDHVGIIARRLDSGVTLSAHAVVATIVTGGHDYHDSRFPRRFHRLAQRVEGIRLEYRPAQGQVHYANVVSVLKLDGALNGSNYLAVITGALTIQDAQVDDVHPRRHAMILAT